MSTPVVSVVIPTYNRAALLPRAVESVVRQTFVEWELVVVDDGSTDATPAIAAEYARRLGNRWVYVRQENRGSSAARNRGIESGKGRFVAFLDSDDEFVPTKLERQLALLQLRPGLGLVYSDYSFVDENGTVFPSVFDAKFPIARGVPRERVGPGLYDCGHSLFDHLIRGYFVATIVGMVRREVLGSEIRFSEELKYAEEWLFFLRVARAARAGFVDEPLSVHHATRGSLARADKHRNLFEHHRMLRAMLGQFNDLTPSQMAAARGHLATACRQLAFHLRRNNRNREALRFSAEAFWHRPDFNAVGEFLRTLVSAMGVVGAPPLPQPASSVVR